MSIGFLIGFLAQAALVSLTLVAPRRPGWLSRLGFAVSVAYNEAPFLFIWLIVLSTVLPALDGGPVAPTDAVAWGLNLALVAGLLVIVWRGTLTGPVVRQALDDGLGPDWWQHIDPGLAGLLRRRTPVLRIVLMPFVFCPVTVRAHRNLAYGPDGRRHRLDLFHRRDHQPDQPAGAPVLVYLHGGSFTSGRKNFEGRALVFRLATQGWVTISADYRLRPQTDLYGHLDDVKRILAWAREHAGGYGADPTTVVLAGGSAGAQLTMLAALTQNEPRFQPGCPGADTSVTAAVALYGWYGGYYEVGGPASDGGAQGHDARDVPPFFIAHGQRDSLAHIETARAAVGHLRRGSREPVVFAELPYGQHAFDLFHSFRNAAVVEGIESFTAWVRSRGVDTRGHHGP
ncbi:alpha/beta hydrolase [Microbacterium sp. A93]|uniref:alpha/beta hydrolase n=1 Tax=Microbacterium sp. A93 TaxID=3450716 RepID=UPI003F4273B3